MNTSINSKVIKRRQSFDFIFSASRCTTTMIDRVSPCWTRNVITGHTSNNGNPANGSSNNSSSASNISSVSGGGGGHHNGIGQQQMVNNTSSPGSSSVLTMESIDSLEGFETPTESGFIASRPCMAEIMGSVPVVPSGGGSSVPGNGGGSVCMNGGSASSVGQLSPSTGAHLTPLTMNQSTLAMAAMHPHMSPSHQDTSTPPLYCNNPSGPQLSSGPNSSNISPSMYMC